MIVLLGCGSSARRGATGWTDRARVRSLIRLSQPDATVDGASPSGGLDDIFFEEACDYFGDAPERAQRCPMREDIDGTDRGRFMRRNARMFVTHKPNLAASWISGRVGTEMSNGSLHMVGVCMRGALDVPPCPVVIYRDDGIEPLPGYGSANLAVERWQLWRLHEVTRAPEIAPAGRALRAFAEGRTSREEVLAALACAREGSRWGPWIEAVEKTVSAEQARRLAG